MGKFSIYLCKLFGRSLTAGSIPSANLKLATWWLKILIRKAQQKKKKLWTESHNKICTSHIPLQINIFAFFSSTKHSTLCPPFCGHDLQREPLRASTKARMYHVPQCTADANELELGVGHDHNAYDVTGLNYLFEFFWAKSTCILSQAGRGWMFDAMHETNLARRSLVAAMPHHG